MEAAIILISLCAAVFGIFYLHFTTRNKERLAMIEKGTDASLLRIGKSPVERKPGCGIFSVLKVGLFLIGSGTGVFMGYFVGQLGMHEGASYPSMILAFAGLGLVVYYLITRKKD